MKIALIGATGQAGSRILTELVGRGHAVTAIVRNPDKVPAGPGITPAKGDVHDGAGLTALLSGHDAAISSVHFSASDPAILVAAVKNSGVPRYLVVGGAGSLMIGPGLRLIDSPDFPAIYKDEATKGAAFLDRLHAEPVLDWTFLSPAAVFVPGERTGRFRLGKDNLLVGPGGSSISFEDFAIALVDEIETPAHRRQRFTVGY